LKLWDATNGYSIYKTLHGHDHTISSVRFVPPRGDLAVSCSRDRAIKVWDVSSGYCVRTIANAHTDWIKSVSSSDDGAWYLSAGMDQVFLAVLATDSRLLEYGMLKAKVQSRDMNYAAMSMSSNALCSLRSRHIHSSPR
jgi:WD40 repeat protein